MLKGVNIQRWNIKNKKNEFIYSLRHHHNFSSMMLSLLTCSYVDKIIARREDYDLTFIGLCTNGDLIGLKQLLQANPSIDISVYNEAPFRNACASGHLHVCQWLLQVSKEKGQDINISAYNEQAFCWAYANNQLHVCRWLQTLNPYLYVIEYDKNGHHKSYRIREKKK